MDTEKALHISTDRGIAMDRIINNKIVSLEILDFLCDDYLGGGISRFVFDFKLNKKFVVKIDCSDRNANVIEHNIWVEAKQYEPKLQKWFAPCHELSRCGRIMLQRKCKTGIPFDQFPKKIPDFFVDRKYQNWGMLDGKMVCFDYAGTILSNLGNFKMVDANWWSVK